MQTGISIADARELLKKYIKQTNTLNHCRESEVVMAALAERLGEDQESWAIAGLLHDLDWELVQDDVNEHGVKVQELLRSEGVSEELISVIVSHVGGLTSHYPESKRESKIEHALAAGETVTGLIFASALVNPEKKFEFVKVSSLRKKMKDKGFAAKVNRDVIMECEKIGLTIDEFLEISLKAMQAIAKEIGL
ncbi:MAG: Hydrolase [Parcubacteria group bacterium GW2011_GWC2_39_14]|nr:MAG: Hydrolase [Parcubacteria group bacterium GW2011_GWC2_39_14]KKR55375.1 MAG: Hydrolase [Parcubacteria group bacterium GW2011_GWA2_40_23]